MQELHLPSLERGYPQFFHGLINFGFVRRAVPTIPSLYNASSILLCSSDIWFRLTLELIFGSTVYNNMVILNNKLLKALPGFTATQQQTHIRITVLTAVFSHAKRLLISALALVPGIVYIYIYIYIYRSVSMDQCQ